VSRRILMHGVRIVMHGIKVNSDARCQGAVVVVTIVFRMKLRCVEPVEEDVKSDIFLGPILT
jgi:hypothetical protein